MGGAFCFMSFLYYRKDGSPYPPGKEGLFQWAKDFEDTKGRVIGFDKLANGIEVSTVWLGLDHNFGFNSRPLIFESMLFVPQKKVYELGGRKIEFDREAIGDQWRYSTQEEAHLGHKMLVKKWNKFKSIEQVLKQSGD